MAVSLNNLRITKSRVCVWLCGAFIAGVGVASVITIPIVALWGFFIVSLAIIALGLTQRPIWKRFVLAGCVVCVAAFGMFRFANTSIPSPALPAALLGTRVRVTGRVSGDPVDSQKSQQVTLQNMSLQTDGFSTDYSGKIMITARRYPQFSYGEELEVSGIISEPENFSEDFDYVSYLARDGIRYVMTFPEAKKSGAAKKDIPYHLFSLKKGFSQSLDRALPEPHASFAAGLLLGEKRGLPQNLLDAFKRTGTTHIIALSGYNITIVADAIMRTLAWVGVSFVFSFWVSACAIILFTMLTGASSSVVRAAIMGILVLIARKEGRMYSIKNALLFAASIMVYQNPKILVFDTSFQLSFLATIGLVYFSPAVDAKIDAITERVRCVFGKRRIDILYKAKKKFFVREILVSTIAAQTLVLPLLIYAFGSVSIISPLSNILVLAAVPYSMFFSFFVGAFGLVSGELAHLAMPAAWLFLEYSIFTIRLFARIPAAAISLPHVFGGVLAMVYAGLFLWKKKYVLGGGYAEFTAGAAEKKP